MLAAPYASLARYNTWMNNKLYALAAELSEGERKRDLGAFFGSLHGTLGHLLLADRIWLGRFTGDAPRFVSRDRSTGEPIAVMSLSQQLYPRFEDLHVERQKTDVDIQTWADTLTDAALEGSFRYANTSGQSFEQPLWIAVTHFFNHQTHHRGQATTLLFQLGRDPKTTDFVAMMRELGRAG